MITFHCPICQKKIQVPNEFFGKAVKCLNCGNLMKAVPEVQVAKTEPEGPESRLTEGTATGKTDSDSAATPEPEPSGPPWRRMILLGILVIAVGLCVIQLSRKTQPAKPEESGERTTVRRMTTTQRLTRLSGQPLTTQLTTQAVITPRTPTLLPTLGAVNVVPTPVVARTDTNEGQRSTREKIRTLLADHPRPDMETARTLAGLYLEAAEDAIDADDYDTARKDTVSACKYAAGAKDTVLKEKAREKTVEVTKLAAEYGGLKIALETLRNNPNDSGANLAVGKFLFFSKGDAEKGLALLVKGSDPVIRAAAEQELLDPAGAEEQMAMGDTWWELGASSKDRIWQSKFRRRAVYWYELAKDRLPEESRDLAITRIRLATEVHESEKRSGRRVVNLIRLADPEKNTVAGTWKITKKKELVSDRTRAGRIEFSYQPPEEYDFRIEFTRLEGNEAVSQILPNPHNDNHFLWMMGGWQNSVAGFELVSGKVVAENPTTSKRPAWLVNGQRYVSVVQVRKDGIKVLVNRKLVAELKTYFSNLTLHPAYRLPGTNTLGVGSWDSRTVFHEVAVVEISGKGKVLPTSATVSEEGPEESESSESDRLNTGRSGPELSRLARYVDLISGGFHNGNRVRIKVGDHSFFENIPEGAGTAGLYLVAIDRDRVVLQKFYNTHWDKYYSDELARDISSLPTGTFVVAAVKDEATKQFTERGQRALAQIGAKKGLYKQAYRTSYYCLGLKGLAPGKAIEKVGMGELKYTGPKAGKKLNLTVP